MLAFLLAETLRLIAQGDDEGTRDIIPTRRGEGEESRRVFSVPEAWVSVGIDVNEARITLDENREDEGTLMDGNDLGREASASAYWRKRPADHPRGGPRPSQRAPSRGRDHAHQARLRRSSRRAVRARFRPRRRCPHCERPALPGPRDDPLRSVPRHDLRQEPPRTMTPSASVFTYPRAAGFAEKDPEFNKAFHTAFQRDNMNKPATRSISAALAAFLPVAPREWAISDNAYPLNLVSAFVMASLLHGPEAVEANPDFYIRAENPRAICPDYDGDARPSYLILGGNGEAYTPFNVFEDIGDAVELGREMSQCHDGKAGYEDGDGWAVAHVERHGVRAEASATDWNMLEWGAETLAFACCVWWFENVTSPPSHRTRRSGRVSPHEASRE